MERSTSKETATKIVKTVATDHVGVKAKDLVSFEFSSIFFTTKNLLKRPLNKLPLLSTQSQKKKKKREKKKKNTKKKKNLSSITYQNQKHIKTIQTPL